MRKLIFAFMIISLSITSYSQTFEVPPMDIKPVSQTEYDAMEPTILSCINWLNIIKAKINFLMFVCCFLKKYCFNGAKLRGSFEKI